MQATHHDLATKLYASPEIKRTSRFSVPRLVPDGFTIEHYAGGVTYRTQNFLDKNRDFVVAEHQALMQASTSGLVRTLFPPDPDEPVASPVRALLLSCLTSHSAVGMLRAVQLH